MDPASPSNAGCRIPCFCSQAMWMQSVTTVVPSCPSAVKQQPCYETEETKRLCKNEDQDHGHKYAVLLTICTDTCISNSSDGQT
mmetsp:Transcript_51527/g.84135  ORF Transcript_51527/g.84135 Transcript_51527/m.84135 type:complete len:84 (-) Transcript_51527:459-710(-)